MGNCCVPHQSCSVPTEEERTPLDPTGNRDINRRQINVQEHQDGQHVDVSHKERKAEEQNHRNAHVKSELNPGTGGPLEDPPPEVEHQHMSACIYEEENHICRSQNGELGRGHAAEGHSLNPAVECTDMQAEVNLQSSVLAPAGSPLRSDADDTLQKVQTFSLQKAEDQPEEMHSETECEALDKPILMSEAQQDNKTQGNCEIVTCDVQVPVSTLLLQGQPGNAQTEDSKNINPKKFPEGEPQNTDCGEQDLPEIVTKVTEENESNPVMDSPTRPKTPEPEVQPQTCKSVSAEETLARVPMDGPAIMVKVSSLEDLAQDMEIHEQKPENQGTSDENEEGCALKVTEPSSSTTMVDADRPANALATEGDVISENAAVETESIEEEAEHNSLTTEDDLYRGEDEIMEGQDKRTEVQTHVTGPEVEERYSVMAEVNILSYSEREWRGKTAKSALIRKGYEEVAQIFGSLCRVRGDNYCALRGTLFQMLRESEQCPAWIQEDDVTKLPEDMVGSWRFPAQWRDAGTDSPMEQLKRSLNLLKKTLQEVSQLGMVEERQAVCERLLQGGTEEYELLEALKFLMLRKAMELHEQMLQGEDVPVFCWLLFARDTSDCPDAFLANHLRHVGFSGGLEQVEMFLLGYAVQRTIQVYRLYKVDTEEFVTYYPDDHKEEWPCVSLITEDDRHYNVPVGKLEAARLQE